MKHEEIREKVKKGLITACWINPDSEDHEYWSVPVKELVNNVVAMIQQFSPRPELGLSAEEFDDRLEQEIKECKETILDIFINECEISQDKTGEVRYEYSQEQFEKVVEKLVNKTTHRQPLLPPPK